MILNLETCSMPVSLLLCPSVIQGLNPQKPEIVIDSKICVPFLSLEILGNLQGLITSSVFVFTFHFSLLALFSLNCCAIRFQSVMF